MIVTRADTGIVVYVKKNMILRIRKFYINYPIQRIVKKLRFGGMFSKYQFIWRRLRRLGYWLDKKFYHES